MRACSRERKSKGKSAPIVATKIGRRLPAQQAALYTYANLAPFVEDCLKSLSVEVLDLVQLHCPPIETYYRPEVFEAMDRLQREGKIRYHGVSVEKVEEGLKALEYPGIVSVQIIFNMFRQRPADLFFEQARKRQVAVICRVPLASGMLTGKFKPDTKFDPSDHRQFNRHGEAFDVGETFAGVPYDEGLAAVEEIKPLVPVRRDHGADGPALGAHARRRISGHSRREDSRPGPHEHRRGGSRAVAARDDGADSLDLREAHQAGGTSALVSARRPAGCGSARRMITDAKMAVINSHQHFWDPAVTEFSWMTEVHKPIRRRFGPEDSAPRARRERRRCDGAGADLA